MSRLTFGNKLAGGFALTLALTSIMAVTSVAALTLVVRGNNTAVTAATDDLLEAQRLSTAMEGRGSSARGFLITGKPTDLQHAQQDRDTFLDQAARLRDSLDDHSAERLLNDVTAAETRYTTVLAPLLEKRQSMHDLTQVNQLLTTELVAARQAVQDANATLVDRIRAEVELDRDHAATQADQAIIAVTVLGALALASGAVIARRLNRALRRQVGTAVGHIQSSSAQLETAAAQQATGGRDQAAALAEITTTISELLITSRQIADGAHRVSKTAEDTETAARHGDATISQTRASIAAIRTQVDEIVQHMLALGEKSQQIGSVVQLVAELAEQTNILAINATIEATGAGEQGRRFAVVAEEIRKLADRTAASAKQIRVLIDEIRAAVNTTVVSTEAGAQAVDAGTRNFDEATTAFRTIAQLVSTTNDATREIELSTKQQTTAVEQVNVAAADTARVSREGETSATQTRQTAAHLAALSSDLLALVGTGRAGKAG
ncbi:methyl-accepting chemotaxis protein [Actinoplanes sp. DH11]|uniref:methyl-accepting chemotaxis protein n=1 Tax=Actinoplanes sp. DH11 TaxID=2857011 RepID=UPI001E2AE486|nr:methyl-accepting chemotaxis protein [Actinoplanes sp. DH11]